MSHIFVKKIISEVKKYAGQEWWYNFRTIPTLIDEKQVETFSKSLSLKYSEITKRGMMTKILNGLPEFFYQQK